MRSRPARRGSSRRCRRTASRTTTRRSRTTRISRAASTARCSSTTGRTGRPSTSGRRSPTGWSTSTPSSRSRTARRTRSSSTRPPAPSSSRARVFGPFMSVEGFERLLADGGDGFIGGGTILGAADPEFWECYWRGDHDACRAHAERVDRDVPEALAARRLGRRLRRLPEPAQGDHGDDRPAGRRAAPPAAAGDRPGEPRGDPQILAEE